MYADSRNPKKRPYVYQPIESGSWLFSVNVTRFDKKKIHVLYTVRVHKYCKIFTVYGNFFLQILDSFINCYVLSVNFTNHSCRWMAANVNLYILGTCVL